DTLTVTGRVKGTVRDDYTVTVFLASSRSGAVSVYRSQCSCPVASDCKHAAAVLIVARHLLASTTVQRPEWERTLDKLLATAPAVAAADVAPLALEFGVERIPAFRGYLGRQDLRIRPARRSRSGGWVRSGISWDDLDFVARSYVPEQRELLLQFRAAAGASARFAMPRNAWLSLSAVSSAFWGLLDQAAGVGLTILAAKPLLGPLRTKQRASVVLDVRHDPALGVLVGPRVLLDEQELDLSSLGVLGEPAHGIFYTAEEAASVQKLIVARLDHLLSRELRQLVVDPHSLVIPPEDEARFLTDFIPRLRQKMNITSADRSVRLPDYVEPILGLVVHFREEHRVRLDWLVHYDSPAGIATYAIDEPPERESIRDPAEEQRKLAALRLPYADVPQLANRSKELPQQPAAHALLDGVAALTFVERVLPQLEPAGVRVRLEGEVREYRRTSAQPSVQVAAVERADSADWFDLRIKVSIDGEVVPFGELFVALTENQDFLILDTGVYFSLDRPEFVQLRELIEESKALQDRHRPELSISRFQASLWEDLTNLGVAIDQSARWEQAVRGLRDVSSIDHVEVPETLQATLRPYQLDGYRWLCFLWSHQLGGILADDMGLGKTLQALALICRARLLCPEQPPFLVVAPTSVVSNWLSEAARFAPELRVVCLTESESKRGAPSRDAVAAADVVIISYALLRIDNDKLAELEWSGLILDEAQFVKNHRAKTYQCARRIAAPFKLAITGTPLENSLMDLWALLSISAPGLFPDPDRFSEYYRRPIERSMDAARLHQLRRRIRPLMLRRSKESVAAELPPKQEQVVEVELDPKHRRIYQTHLQRERQKVLGLIEDLDRNRFTVLRSLTLLRRLSLDPALVDDAHAQVPAAKVEVLLEDLSELVGEGHQALVFSQFTTFLTRIRTRLAEADISYAYLDGRTRNRQRVIQRFRDKDASVFLISLKAGGFGLNLAEADYCFVLDPWWNPATEAQAVDRTHRIGQTKTVMVYRLVARDTIEQKVMDLKARKEELFESVVGGEALAAGALSPEEIRGLLGS
ncbi:MAG TPA: SNF2-related protein, partial [Propionibacteriaceae bacterium]|nr:SNF2-related protein [Propionibacteriaceae bacterium]